MALTVFFRFLDFDKLSRASDPRILCQLPSDFLTENGITKPLFE